MAEVNWQEILGWSVEQYEELRLAGFSFLREGKYEKAALFFQTLVLLNPSSSYDQETLGALYLQMGLTDKALEVLDIALALDPAHEPSQLNRAKALLQLGRKAEALVAVKQLELSKDPAISGDAAALHLAYS